MKSPFKMLLDQEIKFPGHFGYFTNVDFIFIIAWGIFAIL
jgi:hypothetical protein